MMPPRPRRPEPAPPRSRDASTALTDHQNFVWSPHFTYTHHRQEVGSAAATAFAYARAHRRGRSLAGADGRWREGRRTWADAGSPGEGTTEPVRACRPSPKEVPRHGRFRTRHVRWS